MIIIITIIIVINPIINKEKRGQNLQTDNHDPTTLPTHLPTMLPRSESS